MKIAFIGGGAMGEAILSAILDKGITTPQAITVGEIDETRRQYLEGKYGVAVTGENCPAADKSDIVLLAIKPQNLAQVAAELKGRLESSQLVLSIIAGARIDSLRRGLNHGRIIRAMPNTPAQIGQGISMWTATAEVTGQQREWAASILGVMGKEIYVDDEGFINMATAVSGSGPAYVFLLIESLVDAAVHIGLPQDIAHELVLQTLLGSSQLVQRSGQTPAELRRMVTSPDGTTAEALAQFEQGGFSDLVRRAVVAAHNRAKELGDKQQ